MAHITHEIAHSLGLEQAKRVADLALTDYQQRFAAKGLSARWISDTRAEIEFSAKGARVEATVDVLPSVLRIDAKVPLLLRPFKSAAVSAVEREVQRFIEQARRSPA
ncbi:MAG TPA: polyhydroxyalkanoic acid system family protein [Polyangiales bacterium]|nr:polyhydroxyalkanoic acid system family protein [Polyangiales bacterium]